MNADHYFSIGKDHVICEDYALSGVNENLAYIIVCDGCSASKDVDFGARCLAMSAKVHLLLGLGEAPINVGKAIIENANRVFGIFPNLHPQALDSTLLMAWVKNNKLDVLMYGDGVMVHKKKDKIVQVHIQLESGAPDYLSYHLCKERMGAYKDMDEQKKEVILIDGDIQDNRIYTPFDPFVYSTDVEEGDVIALVSDGINSFRTADNTSFDWKTLVPEFTGFKTFEGQFVLRRIGAFKRKCLKEGMTHSDDISVAAIVV